jgi:RNA polymerase sigma-70 factor, ECF subfamily
MRDETQHRSQLTGEAVAVRGGAANSERADAVDELASADLAMLYRRALRLTRDHHAAQDLVQDTLERAYRKLVHFQAGTNMPAWLARIMRNIWISNHRRRAGGPPVVPLDDVETTFQNRQRGSLPAISDVEMSVVDELSAAWIRLAIDGLPPSLRQVVVLADVEGVPYCAIASALAIPPGTVASRLSRGRRRLQRILRDRAGGEKPLARAG